MGRISRSWSLVTASWSVLRSDKELLLFPIVSTILTIIVVGIFAIPVLGSNAFDRWTNGEGWNLFDLVLLFLFYVVTSTVVIFCNAALVGAANIRLNGGDSGPGQVAAVSVNAATLAEVTVAPGGLTTDNWADGDCNLLAGPTEVLVRLVTDAPPRVVQLVSPRVGEPEGG